MWLPHIAVVCTFATRAWTFQDTSPFFAFSSTNIFQDSSLNDVAAPVSLASSLSTYLKILPQHCPTEVYIFAHQAGARAEDFQHGSLTPYIQRRMANHSHAGESKIAVTDVAGHLQLEQLKESLKDVCNVRRTVLDVDGGVVRSHGQLPQLIEVSFGALSVEPTLRDAQLRQNDAFLHAVISSLETESFTLVLTTTPAFMPQESEELHVDYVFESEEKPFTQPLHTDLKRDVSEHHAVKIRQQNSTSSPSAGLFEKYTYMNAGIFQGGLAALILISILYVGISAVAGIEISYASFSKEMGPAAQRKQQAGQPSSQ